ncbi:hypothetical protein TNCV_4639521 [Trichonephila clavipes]|nr:hypothetical protein TNCV_4639521 [Trichonephila clavipes]
MHVNLYRPKCPPVGVVWKLGFRIISGIGKNSTDASNSKKSARALPPAHDSEFFTRKKTLRSVKRGLARTVNLYPVALNQDDATFTRASIRLPFTHTCQEMNQTCFQNVEERSETNITGNDSFQCRKYGIGCSGSILEKRTCAGKDVDIDIVDEEDAAEVDKLLAVEEAVFFNGIGG